MGGEAERPRGTHVHRQQALEDFGMGCERGERAPAQPCAAIHGEHEARHETRAGSQAAVRGLIEGKIAPLHRISQSERLAETETEAFARNGIDGTGGIADERDVAAHYAAQLARRRERATFGGASRHAFEPGGERGKLCQGIFDAQLRIARNERDAHFIRRDRGDINLATGAPVNLNVVRPGFHPEMKPEAVAAAVAQGGIEAGPTADTRASAIGTHDPARRNIA